MKSCLNIILGISCTLIILVGKANCQENNNGDPFKLSDVKYEIIGSGIPIIMIHGMGVDHRVMKNSFEPIFSELSSRWKRIYVDLPGMGKTRPLDWVNNSDDMLSFLEQFIEKVIPDEKFIIAGYSYGGYLARGLLTRKKEKVIGAIFICPLIIPDDSKRNIPKDIFYIKDSVCFKDMDMSTKTLIDYFLVNQNPKTIRKFNADIMSGHKIVDGNFVDKIRNNPKRYEFSKKIVQGFSRFEKKVIFITAKQDILVGFSDAQKSLSQFSNSTFVVIDSAGHAVQIDKQRQFEYQIRNYLNSLIAGFDK